MSAPEPLVTILRRRYACRTCGAERGQYCRTLGAHGLPGKDTQPHQDRWDQWDLEKRVRNVEEIREMTGSKHEACHCQGPLDVCCSPVHDRVTGEPTHAELLEWRRNLAGLVTMTQLTDRNIEALENVMRLMGQQQDKVNGQIRDLARDLEVMHLSAEAYRTLFTGMEKDIAHAVGQHQRNHPTRRCLECQQPTDARGRHMSNDQVACES